MFLDHTLDVLEFEAIRVLLADRTVSASGRERAGMLTPTADLSIIHERLQTITEMRIILSGNEELPLRGIRDIRTALQRARIAGSILDPGTLLDVSSTLQVSRVLLAFGHRLGERRPCPRVKALLAGLGSFQEIEDPIQHAIDADGTVRDQASPTLGRLRREQGVVRDRTRDHLNRFIQSDTGRQALQEPVVTVRDGRYVVPVRADQKTQVKGVVHDHSASGVTLFVEPFAVVEMNNRLRELLCEERREIDRILEALTTGIRQRIDEAIWSVDLLGLVDYYYAAAVLSIDLRAAAPRINQSGRIALYNARHPILALSGSTVMPLTLEMGAEDTTLVVTGPNMGGKTVALKTVGLLTLMAQAGLHTPSDDHSELAVFTQVFADIGDEQSIQANLSTFSAHLRHIRTIIEQADENSLVLLDELGSGTDPTAGAALGMAILETLTTRKTVTLATTHHGALKAFATRTPHVKNGSMAFDVETLSPTYRFRQGIPGGSYALEIGQRLGLPASVLERTAQLIGKEERRLDELIMALDRERQTLQDARQGVERTRSELERLKADYEKRVSDARHREHLLREDFRMQTERLLRNAQTAVDRAIAEVRARQASEESIQASGKTVQDQRSLLQELIDTSPNSSLAQSIPSETSLQPGDRVWLERIGKPAVVLNNMGDRLRVRAGRLELTVARKDVRPEDSGDEPAPAVPPPPPPVRTVTVTQAKPELDVHGYTVDEAIEAVDKYLDQAIVDGLMQVRILHGKGTGILSREIRAFLQQHPLVESTHFAPHYQGGVGVTIVELGG